VDPRSEVTGRDLVLRRYTAQMAPLLLEAGRESVREMYPWMPWCHADLSLEECRKWIGSRAQEWRDDVGYDFAIFEGDRYLGGCGLNQVRRRDGVANLGYWVRSGAMGRGVATRVVGMLAAFGFTDLDLWRIEILMSVKNERSRRVAEKIGAGFEGVLRSRLRLYDEAHDARLYSLLRPPV